MYYVHGEPLRRFSKKFTALIATLAIISNSTLASIPFILSQKVFAATTEVCNICTYTNIPDAITASNDGDTINVTSNQIITSTVAVNKDLTITSPLGVTITTSGSNYVFHISSNGVTIDNFDFVKTDTADQNFIWVQANNASITNNSFNGNWTIGGGSVIRAVLASPNQSNLVISNNYIEHVRQPAYIDGTTTGVISNNYVHDTKGWVVESTTDLNFTGNSWGTNVLDIAIIAPSAVNNYSDGEVVQMSTNNNDAVVENQFGAKRLSDAFVIPTANGNSGDDGGKWNPYTSIQSALNRIVDGGTVHVANGSYSESFTITKNGTQLIGQSKAGVQITNNGITLSGYAVDVTALQNIAIKNMTFIEGSAGANPGYQLKIYQVNGITLDNLAFNGLGAGVTPRTGGVDLNSTSNVNINGVSVQSFSKNGFSITAKYAPSDTASQNYSFANINSNDNAWHGIAFYNYNGSGTVGESINGITFGGINNVGGNGQTGIILAGAPDPTIIANGTPTYAVTGPTSSPLDLGSLNLSSNPFDIYNFQTADVNAMGAILNGKNGNAMTSAERLVQDGKIFDELDNASLGLVTYHNPIPPCDSNVFDIFSNGTVNGQNGWSSTGPFDQEVTDNTYGYATFGCRTLRLSNGVTSGSFGDQTFSSSTTNEAGDTDASNGGLSGGTRQNHFEAQFDIASTQTSQQTGLALSVSPDRGDGARMSYLRFQDEPTGIGVYFVDVQGENDPANFVETNIATLNRATPHTIKFSIDFQNGSSNDVVKIYIDSSLVHTGTTWENYFRFDDESNPLLLNESRTIDSLLFRAAGASVPANLTKGYLFDNVSLSTSTNLPPNTAPNVSFASPTPTEGSVVNGTITPHVLATDDYGMGSYFIRVWKGAFESGIANLVYNNCWSAPGAFLLGTSQDVTCPSVDTSTWDDGTYVLSAQFQDGHIVWGQALRTFIVDNTAPELPVHEFPTDNSFINYNDFWFEWSDSLGAVSYETQYSQNPSVGLDGAFQNIQWTGDYQNIQPTDSRAHSIGANGTWYWQVRAVDGAGNKSAWTSPWKVTIDMEAPAVPTNLRMNESGGDLISNGGTTNSYGVVAGWDSVTGASQYEYRYWNSIPGNPYNAPNYYVTTTGTNSQSGEFNQGDGLHHFQVRAVDSAGNQSAWSSQFDVNYDDTAPVVTIIDSSTSGNVITPDVSASDAGSLDYLWTTAPGVTISNTAAQEPTFTVNVDGTYNFTLTATDEAGNSVAVPFSFTYTSPPAPTVTEEEDTPAVLGATTSTPSLSTTAFTRVRTTNSNNQTQDVPVTETDDTEEETSGKVEGITTNSFANTADDIVEKAAAADSNNFLGLGWWWLAILAAIAGLLWFLLGKDKEENEAE